MSAFRSIAQDLERFVRASAILTAVALAAGAVVVAAGLQRARDDLRMAAMEHTITATAEVFTASVVQALAAADRPAGSADITDLRAELDRLRAELNRAHAAPATADRAFLAVADASLVDLTNPHATAARRLATASALTTATSEFATAHASSHNASLGTITRAVHRLSWIESTTLLAFGVLAAAALLILSRRPLRMLTRTIGIVERSRSRLREARRQASQADRSKSAFLATMSHELRTPISAILGSAEIFADPHGSPDARVRTAEDVQRFGTHLLGVVDDILEFARLSGTNRIYRTTCDPWASALAATERHRGLASCAGLTLTVESAGPIPRTIRTNRSQLDAAIVQLVDNACRFGSEGETVTVRVSALRRHERDVLRFEVVDHGCGIEAEDLSRIFDPFTQVDESHARGHGGTGLGLALSRRRAHLLGGP